MHLRRRASSVDGVVGLTTSEEPDWEFAPQNKHGDSKAHLERSVRGQKGDSLRQRLLVRGKKSRQGELGSFFVRSPAGAPTHVPSFLMSLKEAKNACADCECKCKCI